MNFKSFFLLLSILTYLPTEAPQASIFTIPEAVEKSCVFIMNNDKAVGSGFLLSLKEDDFSFFYLVTAKHVIKPYLKDATRVGVRMNVKNENKATNIPIPIPHFEGTGWFTHPNPIIDLAVLPIPLVTLNEVFDFSVITIDSPNSDWLATQEYIKKYQIRPGDEAFSLGLVPFIYSKNSKNLVMARFGNISMVGTSEIEIFGGQQLVHFLDCPAFGGQSGGPAFVLIERNEKGSTTLGGYRIALLGITSAFIPSPLRVAEVEVSERNGTKTVPIENTGLSRIVPTDYLVDILYSERIQRYRQHQISSAKQKVQTESD